MSFEAAQSVDHEFQQPEKLKFQEALADAALSAVSNYHVSGADERTEQDQVSMHVPTKDVTAKKIRVERAGGHYLQTTDHSRGMVNSFYDIDLSKKNSQVDSSEPALQTLDTCSQDEGKEAMDLKVFDPNNQPESNIKNIIDQDAGVPDLRIVGKAIQTFGSSTEATAPTQEFQPDFLETQPADFQTSECTPTQVFEQDVLAVEKENEENVIEPSGKSDALESDSEHTEKENGFKQDGLNEGAAGCVVIKSFDADFQEIQNQGQEQANDENTNGIVTPIFDHDIQEKLKAEMKENNEGATSGTVTEVNLTLDVSVSNEVQPAVHNLSLVKCTKSTTSTEKVAQNGMQNIEHLNVTEEEDNQHQPDNSKVVLTRLFPSDLHNPIKSKADLLISGQSTQIFKPSLVEEHIVNVDHPITLTQELEQDCLETQPFDFEASVCTPTQSIESRAIKEKTKKEEKAQMEVIKEASGQSDAQLADRNLQEKGTENEDDVNDAAYGHVISHSTETDFVNVEKEKKEVAVVDFSTTQSINLESTEEEKEEIQEKKDLGCSKINSESSVERESSLSNEIGFILEDNPAVRCSDLGTGDEMQITNVNQNTEQESLTEEMEDPPRSENAGKMLSSTILSEEEKKPVSQMKNSIDEVPLRPKVFCVGQAAKNFGLAAIHDHEDTEDQPISHKQECQPAKVLETHSNFEPAKCSATQTFEPNDLKAEKRKEKAIDESSRDRRKDGLNHNIQKVEKVEDEDLNYITSGYISTPSIDTDIQDAKKQIDKEVSDEYETSATKENYDIALLSEVKKGMNEKRECASSETKTRIETVAETEVVLRNERHLSVEYKQAVPSASVLTSSGEMASDANFQDEIESVKNEDVCPISSDLHNDGTLKKNSSSFKNFESAKVQIQQKPVIELLEGFKDSKPKVKSEKLTGEFDEVMENVGYTPPEGPPQIAAQVAIMNESTTKITLINAEMQPTETSLPSKDNEEILPEGPSLDSAKLDQFQESQAVQPEKKKKLDSLKGDENSLQRKVSEEVHGKIIAEDDESVAFKNEQLENSSKENAVGVKASEDLNEPGNDQEEASIIWSRSLGDSKDESRSHIGTNSVNETFPSATELADLQVESHRKKTDIYEKNDIDKEAVEIKVSTETSEISQEFQNEEANKDAETSRLAKPEVLESQITFDKSENGNTSKVEETDMNELSDKDTILAKDEDMKEVIPTKQKKRMIQTKSKSKTKQKVSRRTVSRRAISKKRARKKVAKRKQVKRKKSVTQRARGKKRRLSLVGKSETTRSKKVRTDRKAYILRTGYNNPAQDISLRKIGATIVSAGDSKLTHLCVDQFNTTEKVLCGLAYCNHIVSSKWLTRCIKERSFEDEEKFKIPDGLALQKIQRELDFKISDFITRRNRKRTKLFRGMKLYMTKKVDSSFGNMFIAHGGRLAKSPGRRYSTELIVLGLDEFDEEAQKLERKKFRVRNPTWVKAAILRQKIPTLREFRIEVNN